MRSFWSLSSFLAAASLGAASFTYTANHFAPEKASVGQKWVKSGYFWDQKENPMGREIVKDAGFPGGRALQVKFPVTTKFQGLCLNLDKIPAGSDHLELAYQLVSGVKPAYFEVQIASGKGGWLIFAGQLPNSKPGETVRAVIPFAKVRFARADKNAAPGEKTVIPGRTTRLVIASPRHKESVFKVGSIRYGNPGETVLVIGKNAAPAPTAQAAPAAPAGRTYSKTHFDPEKLPVGQNWMPNTSFWGDAIERTIAKDETFPGGRALEVAIGTGKKHQGVHCRLDAPPAGTAKLAFYVRLLEGPQFNYVQVTQRNNAGGENVYHLSLPKLKAGETKLVVVDFAKLRLATVWGKKDPADTRFVTDRPCAINFFTHGQLPMRARLSTVRYYAKDELPPPPATEVKKKIYTAPASIQNMEGFSRDAVKFRELYYWPAQGVEMTGRVTSDAHEGKQAVEITIAKTGQWQGLHIQMGILPSDASGISFWVKPVRGRMFNMLELCEKDEAGKGEEIYTSTLSVEPGVWNFISIPFEKLPFSYGRNQPVNSNRRLDPGRTFSLNLYSHKSEGGTFIIDDVRWIKAEQKQPVKGNRLLWDPDFETGTSGFVSENMQCTAATAREGFESGRSLYIPTRITSALMPGLLDPNEEAMLSFYVKGDPGSLAQVEVISFHWRWLASRTFPVTNEWSRITLRIPASEIVHPTHRIVFTPKRGNPFLIDRIQLETGTLASPFAAKNTVTLNASINKPGEIATTAELPLTLRGSVTLRDAAKLKRPLFLELVYNGKTVARQPLAGKKGSETFSFPCDFATTAGYYVARVNVVDAEGKVAASQGTPFVVTAPFATAGDYYGIMTGYLPQTALERIGASVFRNNDPVTWRVREKNGPVPVRSEEIAHHPQYPNGIRCLSTIYGTYLPPAYAKLPDKKADVQKFAAFFDRLMTLRKEAVAWFELDNEVDLHYGSVLGLNRQEGARHYAELLKKVHPIAQKHGAKLGINFCSGALYAEQLFQEAPEAFDFYAVHPYSYPRTISRDGRDWGNPETGGFWHNLNQAAELVRKAGNRHELAVGELGWDMATDVDYADRENQIFAAYLARASILMRTVPECQWSIWYTITNNAGSSDYGIFRNDNGMRPLAPVGAFAEAAHQFYGMKGGQAKRLIEEDPYLVSWSLNGERRFALWTTDEKAEPLTLDVPNVKAVDLCGQPLDTHRIPFSFSPVYLSCPAVQGDATAQAIIAALNRRRPCQLTAALSSRNTLRLKIRNNAAKPWHAAFQVGSGTPVKRSFSARETQFIEVPITREAALDKALDIPLKITANGTTYEQKLRLPPLHPVIRRNCGADWKTWDFSKNKNTVTLDRRSDMQPPDVIPWKGPHDLSAKLLFAYDETAFYLFAAVRDDKLEVKGDQNMIWQGDCIQFAFDPDNDAAPREGYRNDYEYGAAFSKTPWCWVHPAHEKGPAKFDSLVTRQGDVTTYRIRIPWSGLAPLKPQPGRVFGFSLVANDCDGGRAMFRLEYGHGIAAGKRPDRFLKMVLLP